MEPSNVNAGPRFATQVVSRAAGSFVSNEDVPKKVTRDCASRQTPSPGGRGQRGVQVVSRETRHRTARRDPCGSESNSPLAVRRRGV